MLPGVHGFVHETWLKLPHLGRHLAPLGLQDGHDASENQLGEGGCDLAVHLQVGLHVLPHRERHVRVPDALARWLGLGQIIPPVIDQGEPSTGAMPAPWRLVDGRRDDQGGELTRCAKFSQATDNGSETRASPNPALVHPGQYG